jgi:hypothetical protein
MILNPNILIRLFMYAIAVILIGIAIGFIINSQNYLGKDKTNIIIQSIVLIILSVLIILFPGHITRVIIGVIFLMIPIMELIYAQDKWVQVKKDIWKYVFGIILILSFNAILKIVLVILGSLLILIAGYLGYSLWKHRNDKSIPNVLILIIIEQFTRKEDKWEL